MRLALGKKEFMCLVVLETGTDNLAEDLSVKLYDLECLIKAWFGCFLSAKIRCSSAFAASSLLSSSAGSMSLGTPMMSRLLFWTRWISFARYSGSPPHTGEAYSSIKVNLAFKSGQFVCSLPNVIFIAPFFRE